MVLQFVMEGGDRGVTMVTATRMAILSTMLGDGARLADEAQPCPTTPATRTTYYCTVITRSHDWYYRVH